MSRTALLEAKARHDKFLRKMGVHPEQMKLKSKVKLSKALRVKLAVEKLERPELERANSAVQRAK